MKRIIYLASGLLLAALHLQAQTWSTQTSGTTSSLQHVDFISATQGWTLGSNNTIRTTNNGGLSWTAQTSPAASGAYLTKVSFVSASNGMALDFYGKILLTSNGGATWTATGNQFYTLMGLHRTSASTAVIVGFNGILKRTTDGGNTWTNCSAPQTYDLYDVTFANATTGWACGSRTVGDPSDPFSSPTVERAILRTTDGGLTWTEQLGGQSDGLFAISFSSATHGCAVGSSGEIWTTNDGGNTWTQRTSNTYSDLHGVHFISATQGWMAGADGMIGTTTDGGVTWATQSSGTTQLLSGIKMLSPGQGYAVGDGGTILRYSAPYITVSPVSATPVNASAAVSVSFSSTGTYTGANVFTAQLSNASGSFASPVNIGTLTSTATSGTISATIPANTPTGTGYLIRVVSTSPVTVAGSSTAPLEITGTPTPLRLTRFSGEARGNGNVLSWTTASEEGVSHFEVERSEDAARFAGIGTLAARNMPHDSYTFTDHEHMTTAYYRLKMVDADGRSEYSSVVKLAGLAATVGSVSVHPNPATDYVRVQTGGAAATLRLSDLSGRVLHSMATENGVAEFSLSNIPAGIYLLHCESAGGKQAVKIVKQ